MDENLNHHAKKDSEIKKDSPTILVDSEAVALLDTNKEPPDTERFYQKIEKLSLNDLNYERKKLIELGLLKDDK